MGDKSVVPLYLDEDDVMKHLDLDKLVNVTEKALQAFSSNEVNQPLRNTVCVDKVNGRLYTMPAYYPAIDALATKLVAFFPQNHSVNLPSHMATILLMEGSTGKLKMILAGDNITGWRTAAASVVATKWLAKSTNILAIIGSGTQGRTHAKLMMKTFSFKEVRIWNHNSCGSYKLCNELISCGIAAKVCDSVALAVDNADVIVTATSSSTPILYEVMEGAHINCVGACRPTWQEISPQLVMKSSVWTDSKDAAMEESGDIILSKATVEGEIGEIINGSKCANTSSTTIFKSLGLAVEDAAAAQLVYESYISNN